TISSSCTPSFSASCWWCTSVTSCDIQTHANPESASTSRWIRRPRLHTRLDIGATGKPVLVSWKERRADRFLSAGIHEHVYGRDVRVLGRLRRVRARRSCRAADFCRFRTDVEGVQGQAQHEDG